MKYRVTHHLRRDGKEYGPGDSITLSADQAARCGSALESWSAREAAQNAAQKAEEEKAEEEKSSDLLDDGEDGL